MAAGYIFRLGHMFILFPIHVRNHHHTAGHERPSLPWRSPGEQECCISELKLHWQPFVGDQDVTEIWWQNYISNTLIASLQCKDTFKEPSIGTGREQWGSYRSLLRHIGRVGWEKLQSHCSNLLLSVFNVYIQILIWFLEWIILVLYSSRNPSPLIAVTALTVLFFGLNWYNIYKLLCTIIVWIFILLFY